MLPSKALSNPTELSAADAVDLLVKTAEATFVSADFVKTAVPAWINELVSPTSLAARTARNGLIGAAGGGVLGMINEHSKPKEERGYMSGAGRGALLGGLLTGAGTLVAGALPDYTKPTTPEAELLAKAKLNEASQANAAGLNDFAAGKTDVMPAEGPNGHSWFPALGAVTNPSEGVIGNLGAAFDPKLYAGLRETPWGTGTGAVIGAGVGAGTGRMVGNYVTGVKSFGSGGDMSRRSFGLFGALKGLAGPHAPNASYGRTGSTAVGGVMGGLGGAILGNGVQALIERFRRG